MEQVTMTMRVGKAAGNGGKEKRTWGILEISFIYLLFVDSTYFLLSFISFSRSSLCPHLFQNTLQKPCLIFFSSGTPS